MTAYGEFTWILVLLRDAAISESAECSIPLAANENARGCGFTNAKINFFGLMVVKTVRRHRDRRASVLRQPRKVLMLGTPPAVTVMIG
jgi:hypothetical protein